MNFSRRNQPATIFEAQLLAEAAIAGVPSRREPPYPDTFCGRWILIGQLIGVDNLVKVLDEFEKEKVYMPSREQFFQILYRPVRDRQIRDTRNRTGETLRAIGEKFGVCEKTVQRALATAGADE